MSVEIVREFSYEGFKVRIYRKSGKQRVYGFDIRPTKHRGSAAIAGEYGAASQKSAEFIAKGKIKAYLDWQKFKK